MILTLPHQSFFLLSLFSPPLLPFRKHLMVFKVFAPRFMYAGIGLLVVDLASIAAVAVGMRVVDNKVLKTFGSRVGAAI